MKQRSLPPRSFFRAALLAVCGAVLFATGCATTPDGEDSSGTGATATAPAPAADGSSSATGSAPDAPASPSTSETAPGDTDPAVTVADAQPSPVVGTPPRYGEEGRYFPESPSRVLFAGLRLIHGAAPIVLHIEQTSTAGDATGVEFRQAITDGERSFVEQFVARFDEDGLSVGLADERLRAVPPPSLEIPRRPRVGETWSVPLGGSAALCMIEEIESATTFDGDVEGCVRVRIDHPSGAVHRRWYHPARGLVRAEARDLGGRLLSGWAVAADAWPDLDRLKQLFAR